MSIKQIAAKYGQPAAKASAGKVMTAHKFTITKMGCQMVGKMTNCHWTKQGKTDKYVKKCYSYKAPCGNPVWFVDHMPKSLAACQCTMKPIITVNNGVKTYHDYFYSAM